MPKVLISPAPLRTLEGPFKQALRDAGFEFVYPPRPAQMVEDEVLQVLPGVDAVLAGSEPYTPRVFAALGASPKLKVIARAGVGYDAVDVAAATAAGVPVCIAPGTNHDAVAEHTFMLMLALAKSLLPQHAAIAAGQWPRKAAAPLRGRTLGVVSLGRIGKTVARRGLDFGMKVVGHEPYPDEAWCRQYGVDLLPLDEVFARADYLSLHTPLTAESRHMVNARTLALMKPTAYLLNTARGGLVDERSLLAALTGGKLAGAGLDVFEEEPPGVNPLAQLPNVVATAHTAGVDHQSLADMAQSAAQAVVDIIAGRWPAEKVVNPEVRRH